MLSGRTAELGQLAAVLPKRLFGPSPGCPAATGRRRLLGPLDRADSHHFVLPTADCHTTQYAGRRTAPEDRVYCKATFAHPAVACVRFPIAAVLPAVQLELLAPSTSTLLHRVTSTNLRRAVCRGPGRFDVSSDCLQ